MGKIQKKEFEDFLNTLPNIKGKKIYIWGTGNTATMYQEGFARIPDFNIIAYVDSNLQKQCSVFHNKPVIAPKEIESSDDTVVLVCSPQKSVFEEILKIWKNLGYLGHLHNIDEAIFGLYKSEIKKVYLLLSDEKSKFIYFNILKNRSNCCLPDDSIVEDNQYFAISEFKKRNCKEIFVDCGAYVGDTIERYIFNHDGVFDKILAFEPDSKNMNAMKYRMCRLKQEWNIIDDRIMLFSSAVSNEKCIEYINRAENNGLGSSVSSEKFALSESCNSVVLDDYINSKNVFLKADIEGYEHKMLEGARKSIEKYSPKLSISIYHNAVDLITIPLLISELNSKYRMFIRHHSYTWDETILYAYVD